jgi:hypothetical protein
MCGVGGRAERERERMIMRDPPVFHVGTGPEDRPYCDWLLRMRPLATHPVDVAFFESVLWHLDALPRASLCEQEDVVRMAVSRFVLDSEDCVVRVS